MKILPYNNRKIFVALGSEIDVFRYPQFSNNEKLQELKKNSGFVYYQVKDLKSASEICRKYISILNLRASNWIGGRVIDENFDFIANISFNGRVWDNEDFNKASEIELC